MHFRKWDVYYLTWAQWLAILYQIIHVVSLNCLIFIFTTFIFYACLDVIETVLSVMVHPSQAARLAAAWCIRCVCIALPSQCTPLIDRYFLFLILFININNLYINYYLLDVLKISKVQEQHQK